MGSEILKTKEGSLASTTKPTFSDVWAQYSSVSCRDVRSCLLSNSPSVGSLVREYGTSPVSAMIEGCIVNLCEFLNIPKGTMSESQVRQTAILIVEEHKNMTVSDILLVFRRAKLGQWGEFYGRIDGQMILGWFGKYFDERCEESALLSEVEGHRMKDREQRIFTPDVVNRIMGIGKKLATTMSSKVVNDMPEFTDKNYVFYNDLKTNNL